MLVIGIDPGIAITGYGLVIAEQDKIKAIDYGVISTTANEDISKRLEIIHDTIKEILLLHKPDSGSVEKLFFQRNVTTAVSVGQARGVALLAFSEMNIPIFEYLPKEIKQSVTGYGGAGKPQIQQMVKMILGLEEIPRPDDAADALAAAICHISCQNLRNMITASTS